MNISKEIDITKRWLRDALGFSPKTISVTGGTLVFIKQHGPREKQPVVIDQATGLVYVMEMNAYEYTEEVLKEVARKTIASIEANNDINQIVAGEYAKGPLRRSLKATKLDLVKFGSKYFERYDVTLLEHDERTVKSSFLCLGEQPLQLNEMCEATD